MNVRRKGDFCIVCPGGELSSPDDAERLAEELKLLFDAGNRRVCVDLSDSPVINSSAIGAIAAFHAEASKKGGEIVVLNARNVALEALLRTNINRIIRFVRSVEEL